LRAHGALWDHYGLYVGRGRVVHNIPVRGVEVVTLGKFARGRPLRVVAASTPGTRMQRVRRALRGVGRAYDAVKHNCEHFISEVLWGPLASSSPQLRMVGVALGLALAGVLETRMRKKRPR
jgi:Lecithin retinol acyltransferase